MLTFFAIALFLFITIVIFIFLFVFVFRICLCICLCLQIVFHIVIVIVIFPCSLSVFIFISRFLFSLYLCQRSEPSTGASSMGRGRRSRYCQSSDCDKAAACRPCCLGGCRQISQRHSGTVGKIGLVGWAVPGAAHQLCMSGQCLAGRDFAGGIDTHNLRNPGGRFGATV